MKKLVSLILATLMIFSVTSVAFATEDIADERISLIETNINLFLDDIGENQYISNYIPLNNFGDELEALFFPLSEGGYVVASYKDGHVIEYSPNSLSSSPMELSTDTKIYYDGPFAFYVKRGHQYEDIVTGAFHDDVSDYYSCDYVPNIEIVESEVVQDTNGPSILPPPSNYISTGGIWYCTITGITNLLQYYSDHYGADMYSGSVSSTSGLRNTLNVSKYIYNGGLYLRDAATGHTSPDGENYLGLRSYLGRADVTTYPVTVTGLTRSKVKAQISTYLRPALLHVYTSCVSSGASAYSTHIVLCYGYSEIGTTTYYIVNDGWGNNVVYACADDIPTTFEMMYL